MRQFEPALNMKTDKDGMLNQLSVMMIEDFIIEQLLLSKSVKTIIDEREPKRFPDSDMFNKLVLSTNLNVCSKMRQ